MYEIFCVWFGVCVGVLMSLHKTILFDKNIVVISHLCGTGGKRDKEVGPNRHIPRHKDKLFYKPVLDIILGVCTLTFQSFMLEVSSFVLEVSKVWNLINFLVANHPLLSVPLHLTIQKNIVCKSRYINYLTPFQLLFFFNGKGFGIANFLI